MNQMLIYLIIGLAVSLAGFGGFRLIGNKEKKDQPDDAQRELVYSCGDEALIQFYESAVSDEEREQIAGFAAELIARNERLEKSAPDEVAPDEVADMDDADMDALAAEMAALGSVTGRPEEDTFAAADKAGTGVPGGAAAGLGLIAAGLAASHEPEAEPEAEAEDDEEEPDADRAAALDWAELAPQSEPEQELDGLGLINAGLFAASHEPEPVPEPEIHEEAAEAGAGPDGAEDIESERAEAGLTAAPEAEGEPETETEPEQELDGRGLIFAGLAAALAQQEQPVEQPAPEVPVEEAPVEEAPVEEVPAEEAPVEEAPVEEAPVEEVPVAEEDDELIRAQIAFAEAQAEEPPLKKGPTPEERADFFTKQADAAIAAILGGSAAGLLNLSQDEKAAEEDLPFAAEAPAAEPAPAAEDAPVAAPAEEAPAEEAPVEEAPIEEAPIEEAPVEEAPIEEAPIEEAPIEEAPIEEAPIEEAPIEEAPIEEAPIEEAPVEEAPVEEAPIEEAPIEEAPIEEAPIEEAPVEEAPVEEVPVEEAPVEEAPIEEAPVEDAPVEEAPVEEVPVEEATVEEATVEEAPVEDAPVEDAPVEEAPVEEAPIEEAPIEEAPIEEAPVEEAPIEEAPVEDAPVEEAPVEEAPAEEAPAEEAPAEEAPAAGGTPLPFDFFGKRDYSGKDGLGVVGDACITTSIAATAADSADIAAMKARAAAPAPAMMSCPYCGAQVEVGSHFCIICGCALDAPPEPPVKPTLVEPEFSTRPAADLSGAGDGSGFFRREQATINEVPALDARVDDEAFADVDAEVGDAPQVRRQPFAAAENTMEMTLAEQAKAEYTQQVNSLAEDFAAKRGTNDFWQLDMAKEAAADHRAGVTYTSQYSSQLPEMLAAARRQAAEAAAAAAAEAAAEAQLQQAETPPAFAHDISFEDTQSLDSFSPTEDIMASVRELEKRIMADLELDFKDAKKQ